MSIAEKKAEILGLIGQLQPDQLPRMPSKLQQETANSVSPPVSKSQPDSSMSSRIERRLNEVARLKEVQEKIGIELLEERLLLICQDLENRIAQVEKICTQNGQSHTQPVAPSIEKQPDVGTNIADFNTDMFGDLNNLGAMVQNANASVPAVEPVIPNAQAKHVTMPYDLAGRLKDALLSDIFQLLSSNSKSGKFTVLFKGQEIELFFLEGEVVHGQMENIEGVGAFYAAMAVGEGGSFQFIETEEIPEKRTISANTQFLILEALRQIDEQGDGQ